MKACQLCGKGAVFGKSGVHKHGGRWVRRAPKHTRIWRANLHKARIKVGSNFKTMLLCTKCLRKIKGKRNTLPKTQQVSISPVAA